MLIPYAHKFSQLPTMLVWKPQKKLYNANPENAGMMIQRAGRCRFTAPCPFRHAIVNAEHHSK